MGIMNGWGDCEGGSLGGVEGRRRVLIRSKWVFKRFIIGREGWNMMYVRRESKGGLGGVGFVMIEILIGNGKVDMMECGGIWFVVI